MSGVTPDPHVIRSEAELRAVIGDPSPVVQQKIFAEIDEFAAEFIARAPMVLIATVDAEGRIDVSPKGDAPGFVHIADARTLLVPDRPGNKLVYGFRNLLERPQIGMIFVVPGTTETLRVNGTAEITRAPDVLASLAARGKDALLATRVTVEECFFHCGKAFVRAGLWDASTWPEKFKVGLARQMSRKLSGDEALAEQIDQALEEDKRSGL
jgi:PPOX class probable FMN-dependent enzyme